MDLYTQLKPVQGLFSKRPICGLSRARAPQYRPGRVSLPAAVWTELFVSNLLLPFCQFDLSSPWSTRVEATDASMSGLGRAFAVMPMNVVKALGRYCSAKGTYTNLSLPWGIGLDSLGRCPFLKVRLPVKMVKWKEIGTPWNPVRITAGEGDAVVWAAQDRLRRPSDDGHRFVHPIDSAAMLGALTKGRSSSKVINSKCRKVAAVNLCGGHEPFYLWVPSAENPADRPSRLFEVDGGNGDSESGNQPESRYPEVDLRHLDFWPSNATFFIHFCSGPRRHDDVLCWVEKLGALAGFNIVGVAVDPLAVKPFFAHDGSGEHVAYGDLLDHKTGLLLLNLIESGRIIGGLASPPCSTISAARHIPLNKRGGPRPLRGRDNPWEPLDYCSEKEISAVMLGSCLYLLCLGFLGEIRLRGGWTGLEHPADRGSPYPSFFSTPEVAAYKIFTGSRYIVTDQCMFGAVSKKPTGLLVPNNCLNLARRCNHSRKHIQLKGLDSEGNFMTTPAARYPADFCHALAASCIDLLTRASMRSYRMPYAPFGTERQSLGFDPWGLGRHVRWAWPQPSPTFLAEHLKTLNSSKVHRGIAAPQQWDLFAS